MKGLGRLGWRLLGVGALATACAELADLDLDRLHPPPPDAGQGEFQFSHYLKATAPKPMNWFGYVVSADSANVVISAPFETIESAGVSFEGAGSLYVFDSFALDAPPKRFTLPNADAGDGNVPTALFPADFPRVPVWAGVGAGLSRDFLFVASLGEDSASAHDPRNNEAPESGAVFVYDRADLDKPPQYIKGEPIRAGDVFGFGVAQAGDWLAIGAPGDDRPTQAARPKRRTAVSFISTGAGTGLFYANKCSSPPISKPATGSASTSSCPKKFSWWVLLERTGSTRAGHGRLSAGSTFIDAKRRAGRSSSMSRTWPCKIAPCSVGLFR
jgi:hypothetical protein